MNARRIPFQFSTTDPLARQRELEKRFGLQSTCPKMYIDVNKPLSMGATSKGTNSPRLQHRVPIFAEGYDQPIHSSSVDSMTSVPDNKKPNVRVIPIEIEGADKSSRHRTFSGPADIVKDRCDSSALNRNETYPFNRYNFESLSRPSNPKHNEGRRIFNIPIQVEDANNLSRSPKVDVAQKPKEITTTSNGYSQPKLSNKVKSLRKNYVQPELNKNETDNLKNNIEVLLKKIEDVLTEFKTYEAEVIKFSETSKNKQYRYLDEMLTRCMLRLDDIDTMGNEQIRLARKNAVKKIQASIDLLESKASIKSEVSQVQSIPNKDSSIERKDDNVEMTEMDLTATDKIHNEISDRIISDTEIQGKVESSEVTSLLEKITNSVTERKISSETENGNYVKESLYLQQNSVPEMEMSKEVSISSHNALPPEMLKSTNGNTEQNDFAKLTDDVEMDENMALNVIEVAKKSLSLETEDKESNVHMPDVEMEEICDIPTVSEKIEYEDAEEVIPNPDCSENTNHNSVDLNAEVLTPTNPKDAEMKDIGITQSTSDDKFVCDISEQDATTSPPENIKLFTLK